MNLAALLAERAAQHPERAALIDSCTGSDRVLSFRELHRRVAAGAEFLSRCGLQRGQTILVFQPVSLELYEFLLSSFHAGLRVMLADPSAGRAFLSLCCQRLRPDAFFGSWKAQWLRLAVPELRSVNLSLRSGGWFPRSRSWNTEGDGRPPTDVPEEEPALITWTSGSTGVPKAAVRTHGFLLAQHRALSHALEFQAGEVDLITLPVFVLANLASGLTSVLADTDLAHPGRPDSAAIHRQCQRHQVTRCAGSPAFFEALLHSPGSLPPFAKLYTGGAPVFPDLLRRLRTALPTARIHSVYGSTEAEPIAHQDAGAEDASAADLTRAGGGLCAGAPTPETRLRILRDHWGTPLGPLTPAELEALEAPAGQAGEIIVSGEHVLRGYLAGQGDRETKIQVGDNVWHRTGDAGWLDRRGRVWLLGRCAEKLPPHPAGEGLPTDALRYPFAMECALREAFPQLRTAALEWRGQRTLVVGRQCEPAQGEALRQAAGRFGITQVRFLEALPLDRRHNAKIDYPALRKRLG